MPFILETSKAPALIETTDNRIYRVVGDIGAQFDCIEVKKVRGAFVDVAKPRPTLILKSRIMKTLAA